MSIISNTLNFVKGFLPGNRLGAALVLPFEDGFEWLTEKDKFRRNDIAYKSWIYIATNKNATACTSAPLRLYVSKSKGAKMAFASGIISKEKRDYLAKNASIASWMSSGKEVEELYEHPLLDVLKSVNPHMTYNDLQMLKWLHLELYGNAYWYMVRNKLGQPVEFWPMNPKYVYVVPSKTEYIKGYIYRNGTNQVPFDADEVVHFKYISPNDRFYGFAPVSAITDAFNIMTNLDRYQNRSFSNMARPEGVLSTTTTLNDSTFERVKKAFAQRYSGTSNAMKPLILEEGLKWEQMSFKPVDLGMRETEKSIVERVANAYGIPYPLLVTEDVNMANAETALKVYYKFCILPKLSNDQATMNEFLASLYDENIFFAYDNPSPEDKDFELKKNDAYVKNGVMTRNEVRTTILGFPPLPAEDGDIVPSFPGGGSIMFEPNAPVKSVQSEKAIIKRFEKVAGRSIVVDKAAYWKAYDKRLRRLELDFQIQVKKYFEQQRKAVMAEFRKQAGKKDAAPEFTFEAVLAAKKWREKYAAIMEKSYQKTAKVAGDTAYTQLDMGISFDLANPMVQDYIGTRLPWIADELNKTTLDALYTQLSEGTAQGESIDQLARRIESVFDDAEGYRAVRIARTETISSYSQASEAAYVESDLVAGKEWIATRDDRVRETHLALDGVIVPLGDDFNLGGIASAGPGQSGEPSEDINCRCAIAPVVKE